MIRASRFRTIDADESFDLVKSGDGHAHSIHAINLHTAVLYLKLYDAVTADENSTPILTFAIPAQASGLGGGFVFDMKGMIFSTGLCIRCTTGVADNDTGAPAANKCLVNILFE